MTTKKVAASSRQFSTNLARCLVSAAVSAAIAGTALPQRAMAADEEAVSEVTITGSRIVRRDLSAPSPVVTVSKETFENTASTGAESALNKMPQFVPINTQFTSSIQSGATSSPGAATLNLRGLGSNRNLVLVDGHRAQPANASLVIDINTIPSAAIESVEVITGGASAVYGPDAMAGVVNFVLKKNFQGLDVDIQRGGTFRGDGTETRYSVLMGMNGAENRGNIMVGLDWTKRDPVYTIDRDFYVNGWMDPGNPGSGFLVPAGYAAGQVATNQPSQAAINALFPTATPPVGRASEIRFNSDGTPFVTAGGLGYKGPLNDLTPGPFQMIKKLSSNGNLDQIFTQGYVSTPLDRHSIFGRGTFNLTDSVSAFTEINYSNVKVLQRGGLPPAITTWQAPIPRDGRPLPAALNALLDSRPDPTAPWSLYRVLDFNGPINTTNTSDVWQLLAGLRGTLPFKDWTWEVYGSRGSTRIIAETSHLPSLERYQFLVAKPNFGKGTGFTSAGSGYKIDCASGLPIFAQFTPDDSCIKGIETRMRNLTDLDQDIGEANFQGGVFNLPAGELRAAVGLSYRKNDFRYDPGNSVEQVLDNPIGLFASNGTQGSTNVKEAYGELLVPIVNKLDLELGLRYSDFNTAGGKYTYKGLFTWKAVDSVSFRGGYQYATRAPNTAELFTGPTQNVVSFPSVDPCSKVTLSPWGNVPGNPNRKAVQALCRAIIGNSTSAFDTQTYNTPPGPDGFTRQTPPFFPLEIEVVKGNPKVGPETGKTWTLGAVITEPFKVNRLSATVDLYRIQLGDTISPISSTTVYNNCFNSDGQSNPTLDVNNSWCQLIRRDPITGDRSTVDALYSNLGTLTTEGVDLTVSWFTDLGPGQLSLNTAISYLHKFEYQTAPTSKLVDAKGTFDQGGLFTYRTLSNVGYRWSGFNVNLNWEHLPSIRDQSAALNPATTIQGAPHYDLFNLSAGYSFSQYSVRVGIDNVLNKDPLVVGTNPGVDTNTDLTNPGYYDPLGRRYYVGVKASF